MTSAATTTRNIRVVLRASQQIVTAQQQVALPDSPTVAVPVSLNSYGLTQLVDHLLREESAALVLNGRELLFRDVDRNMVLASTLDKHLVKHSVNEENVLLLEYFFRPSEPSLVRSTKVEDWVAGIRACGNSVFTCGFDGSLTKLTGAGITKKKQAAHLAPVRGITSVGLASGKEYLLTASKDCTVRAWTTDDSIKPLAVGGSNGVALDCLDAARSSDKSGEVLVVAGGVDGRLFLFQLDVGANGEEDVDHNKRKQTAPSPAVGYLTGHTDKVSSVVWQGENDPVTCYSSAWDSTIRVWDATRQMETATWRLTKAATCMALSTNAVTMVSGHADNVIRVWDPRVGGGDSAVQLVLVSHHGLVSSVKFKSEYMLASCSYDCTVKLWDTRRSAVLHTIEQVDLGDRLFAVEWGQRENRSLYVGGASGEVREYAT
jgi:ribosome biogenesis protein YTM1